MRVPSRRYVAAVLRNPRRKLSSVTTIRQTLCVLRCACLSLVVFWSLSLLALTILTAPYLPPTVSPSITMDDLVDRDVICDRLQRGLLELDQLNSSVVDACRRWNVAQADYFRARPRRVNTFRRRLLKTGDRICSESTFVVVVVHSLHTHADRRAAIRETWGNASITGIWPDPLSRVCTAPFHVKLSIQFNQ